jgi:single-strand DNA-binding protein
VAKQNINTVVITGNLTRDPELRALPSGTSVCKLGVAVGERRKISGEWADYTNYFDVTVWGASGEACAQYLTKGSPVAVSGRLQWSRWESEGNVRTKVDITADRVQFLSSREDDKSNGGQQRQQQARPEDSDVPPDTDGLNVPAGVPADQDIPFARSPFPDGERVSWPRFTARRQSDN